MLLREDIAMMLRRLHTGSVAMLVAAVIAGVTIGVAAAWHRTGQQPSYQIELTEEQRVELAMRRFLRQEGERLNSLAEQGEYREAGVGLMHLAAIHRRMETGQWRFGEKDMSYLEIGGLRMLQRADDSKAYRKYLKWQFEGASEQDR